MKKTIMALLVIMTLTPSAVLAKNDLTLTVENTFGFQLPSDIDIKNAGVLSDVIKISAEIKDKYTAEFSLPLNLIVHSLIGEPNKEPVFFLGSPQISIGLILNRNKHINHTFNLAYSIPVGVSKEASEYVENNRFHRVSVSYRLGYVSDPVVFYTGLQIESSIPYKENSILYSDLPTIVLPLDFIFSINRVFSAKASVQMKADMPILRGGDSIDSRILYSLFGGCELIASIGKNYIRFGLSKNLSTPFSAPMLYVSYFVIEPKK